MNRLFLIILLSLISSGCVSHPAQYQRMEVSLKNNEPCFSINPSGLDKPLSSHAPTIMKREDSEWKTISKPATYTPVTILETNQCSQWGGINWEEGEYDVALKVMGGDDAIRYAARFKLQKNATNKLSIINIE
ncbi:putative T6SS immunity periplasmic lipoprotein [Pseudescherichia sp.]|uniref:putative T6SS immunity periplasmic lipoprotein n=1 Tax=Pseudescherichia sp. TaxID=2055881 RepID=UPI00289F8784|nr:putative T6SS immunity periplasmic lipoprotein [Pseudescherichia sp.]